MASAESPTFPGMTSCFMRPVILHADLRLSFFRMPKGQLLPNKSATPVPNMQRQQGARAQLWKYWFSYD